MQFRVLLDAVTGASLIALLREKDHPATVAISNPPAIFRVGGFVCRRLVHMRYALDLVKRPGLCVAPRYFGREGEVVGVLDRRHADVVTLAGVSKTRSRKSRPLALS